MNKSFFRRLPVLIDSPFLPTTYTLGTSFVRFSLLDLLPWWLSACVNLADHLAPNTQRIQAVERSLGANVRTSNDKDWTIEERMKYYNVPGLSIAIIQNHQIEWAKAYGWADIAGQKPVTTETRFMVGSMVML